MSNLKLPEMNYSNLVRITAYDGRWKKIAYATWVRWADGDVEVKHHNSVIAVIDENVTRLDTHGFNTRTTSNRMHRIAWDNCRKRIGIRDGLIGEVRDDGSHVYFHSQRFYNVNGV